MIRTITNYFTNAVIWTGEAETVKDALHVAIATGANLTGAYLRGANLTDANLRGAYLRGAYLRGANLRGANLTDANLTDANLTDANLTGANLTGANLRDANLTGAYLRGANLTGVRDDLWAVLSSAPAEAAGLLVALRAGTVDGSTYSGQCACLLGTLAKVRGCDYDAIPGLTPQSSRPAEVWFMQIKPGQTPENHEPAKLAAEWVEDWITRMQAAFTPVATP